MATWKGRIVVSTSARIAAVNITREVAAELEGGTVKDGLLCVSVRHATCALALNEDEHGLRKDLERVAATLLSPIRRADPFLHDRIDDNAQAHLTACVLGPSITVPLEDGRMLLGTWQSLLLVELDGPRSRTVDLTAAG
ncbi:MAG TPA: secondary thiamine-phosphate synthase enzyme YjbQ [Candidatus Saccharimonadales bacterium]|nr:secondary thiamine-phosphate synthase enzyme YjbQ [Candidatus Saccharimonadales bacterium]